MKTSVIVRLENKAAFHEKQAEKIRGLLAELRGVLSTPTRPRVAKRQALRLPPEPTKVTVTKSNGHVRSGKGIGAALRKALLATPGLTPSELWERIDGKFSTTSKTPRGLLNVELQRLKRDNKAINDNGRWRLADVTN